MHIRLLSISLAGSHFFLLVVTNFRFNSLPVDRNIGGVLLHFLVGLRLVVHFEETLAISNYRVHVGLVLDGNLEGTIPLVHLDVQLDCAIVKTS
jgi:hypothetical protein